MEPKFSKSHEDHIAAKGEKFFESLHFSAQIHSDEDGNEKSGRKSSGKRMENNSKRSKIGSFDKVKSKKEVILEAQKEKKTKSRCHLKKPGVGTTISEVQRTCCASTRYCEG